MSCGVLWGSDLLSVDAKSFVGASSATQDEDDGDLHLHVSVTSFGCYTGIIDVVMEVPSKERDPYRLGEQENWKKAAALGALERKEVGSAREAALSFDVPQSTFHDYKKSGGKRRRVGSSAFA
jgi:hypothetical protein